MLRPEVGCGRVRWGPVLTPHVWESQSRNGAGRHAVVRSSAPSFCHIVSHPDSCPSSARPMPGPEQGQLLGRGRRSGWDRGRRQGARASSGGARAAPQRTPATGRCSRRGEACTMLSGAPEVGGAGAQRVFEEGRPMWLEQHAGAVAGSHGEGTAGPQGALGASAVP